MYIFPRILRRRVSLRHGQPLCDTHPHILGRHEVLPGTGKEELMGRRRQLHDMLPKNSIAVVPSYRVQYSSQNIFYRFHQNNNLRYLSGLLEPECCLVVDAGGRSIIFHTPADEHTALWEGPRTEERVIKTVLGIDLVYDLRELGEYLRTISDKAVYYNASSNDTGSVVEAMRDRRTQDLTPYLHQLRVRKSEAEIDLMRGSARAAAGAFQSVMGGARSMTTERDIAAELEHRMRQRGADGMSYVPVVAGGDRGCVIHYTRNDQMLERGGLVLCDAGAYMNGYCSDVTRTWPMSGKFTGPQREVYEAVLRVQKTVLGALMSDYKKFDFEALNALSYQAMVREVERLGISDARAATNALYPHSIGHYLGMDLHDCPLYPQDLPFKPGMVLTVEPGLYIPADPRYPEKYHGVAVRIEDDVVLRADGSVEILTEGIPRDVDAVEAMVGLGAK